MRAAKALCLLVAAITAVHFALAIGRVGLGRGAGLDVFLSGYLADPWQAVIDIDLMAGLLLAAGWIWWRERDRAVAIGWIAVMFWWGNIVLAVYAWRALDASGGSWERFFGGAARAGADAVREVPAHEPSAGLRAACLAAALGIVVAIALGMRATDFALLPTIGYACGLGCFLPALYAASRRVRGGAA